MIIDKKETSTVGALVLSSDLIPTAPGSCVFMAKWARPKIEVIPDQRARHRNSHNKSIILSVIFGSKRYFCLKKRSFGHLITPNRGYCRTFQQATRSRCSYSNSLKLAICPIYIARPAPFCFHLHRPPIDRLLIEFSKMRIKMQPPNFSALPVLL